MLKLLFFILLLLALCFTAFLFYQGKVSVSQPPPQPDNTGELPACPNKPNCVSSGAAPTDFTHYIDPIAAEVSMEELKAAVIHDGGNDVVVEGNLLTATYKSRVFGFIDDLLMVKNADQIQVRSSSRVGYSDFDANRKRVERLRAALDPS